VIYFSGSFAAGLQSIILSIANTIAPMDLTITLLVAVGLSMDCFAVALAAGSATLEDRARTGLIIAAFFGGFQAVMALLGWGAGYYLAGFISGLGPWIAFALLLAIGIKMIYEAFFDVERPGKNYYARWTVIVLLSVATSIDALGAGLGIGLLQSDILVPAMAIGVTSFFFSLAGVELGSRLARRFGSAMEVTGGIILIIIGFQILLRPLYGT
jgi:putative Mn2+ efflux pump MntP